MRSERWGLGLLAVLLVGAAGHARTVAGVEMPERIEVDGHTLNLVNMDLRERTLFNIDVYVWGLYLEDGVANAQQALSRDVAGQLRFHMKRDVSRERLAESIRELRKHPTMRRPGMYAALEQFASAVSSVREGEELVVTYIPDNGTLISGAVRRETVIPGEDFAHALFTAWLDWFGG